MFTIQCQNCHSNVVVSDISTNISACSSCQHQNHLEPEATYLPRFVVIQGADKGTEFLVGEDITLGRGNYNAIQLKEPKASRKHASIEFDKDHYLVRDLESGNGTHVNGKLIKDSPLYDKDLLRIGDAVLMFRNSYNYQPDVPEAVLSDPSGMERTKGVVSASDQSFLQSADKLRILLEVNNAISSILDLEELLSKILDTVFQYIQAERGCILFYEPDEKVKLKNVVTKVRSEESSASNTKIRISSTLMERVISTRDSVLTADTMLDKGLSSAVSIVGAGTRSAMSVPLTLREKLLGVLHVDTTKKTTSFNTDALELLTGIASQAAIAIENAKLLKQVEKELETRGHLQRYLSPELVEQVVNKKIDIDVGGQTKKATILFTDLRGFTTMSENIGGEAVVAILNDYFTRMVDIVFTNHGTLDKFIGDAIMAIWGLPVDNPEDAIRSVKACIEMEEELFYFNMTQKKRGLNALKMGGGINTGDVVVGNMGSPKRMEYTVIGPPVNLSARVEHLTTRNQVLITDTTLQEAGGVEKIKCVQMEATKVKGIDRLIYIFGVVAVKNNDGTYSKFFPIKLSPDPNVLNSTKETGANPQGTYEGLLQTFSNNTVEIHVDPMMPAQGETYFYIDMPKIIPNDTMKIAFQQTQIKYHAKDEYLEATAALLELPDSVKDFFANIFA